MLDIRFAPKLSGVSETIRLSFYLLLLWAPLLIVYALIAENIYPMYPRSGPPYESTYGIEYPFYNLDPWMSLFPVGFLSIMVTFVLTIKNLQLNTALLGFVFSLVALPAIFVTTLVVIVTFVQPDSQREMMTIGTWYLVATLCIFTLGFLCGARSKLLTLLVHVPALYVAGAAPLATIFLFFGYEKWRLFYDIKSPPAWSVPVAFLVLFIVGALLQSLLWKHWAKQRAIYV